MRRLPPWCAALWVNGLGPFSCSVFGVRVKSAVPCLSRQAVSHDPVAHHGRKQCKTPEEKKQPRKRSMRSMDSFWSGLKSRLFLNSQNNQSTKWKRAAQCPWRHGGMSPVVSAQRWMFPFASPNRPDFFVKTARLERRCRLKARDFSTLIDSPILSSSIGVRGSHLAGDICRPCRR